MSRPTEAIHREFKTMYDSAQTVKWSLPKIRHVIDPDGSVEARCDNLIAEAEKGMEDFADRLAKERKEYVTAERAKDEWASPSCHEGWLCPDSPTGVCIYEKTNPYDPDCCDHCGFPDERK